MAEGVARFRTDWIDDIRAMISDKKLEPERVAQLLLALDESKETWAIVHNFGELIDEAYWKRKHSFAIVGGADDLLFAIDKYISCGRPMAAIEAPHRRLGDVPSRRLMQLLLVATPEINALRGNGGTMSVYYIEQIFDELENRSDIPAEELAKMEFAYRPLTVCGTSAVVRICAFPD
ncbi:hypothetical protein OR16_21943 [Cupriavidus basilensis OR16]|uniref:Uncharacterized protein n=1 Tax=Cupriavidus basilensis OR16 TaxID=1127483 RepID=H1S8R7_9BURK|nr:hypothetical protein [Cupriavidus basilensis]EHP41109.1 hypothetical protein OR16_21943 [Cupriavidus basilensis OR16]